ncbi:MAG: glycosyltransferase family 39 protein [Dehalococcoidia bacterium]
MSAVPGRTAAPALAPPFALPTTRAASAAVVGWLAVALTLVGFCLRLLNVGAPSYWGDEMVSVTVARMTTVEIPGWLAENDPHPPLYYLTLHGWTRLTGESELATRTLSALLGILTIPLIGLLGRWMFGPVAAGVVMAIVALNPLQIAQARDARMYPLLVVLTVGATVVLWRLLTQPSRVGWAAYVLLGAASLYAHYYGGLALIAHGLFVLTLIRRRPQFVLRFAGATLAIGLLYLPWLAPGLVVIGAYEGYGWATGETGIGTWPQAVARCLQVFLTGPWTPDEPWNQVVAILAIGLAGGGVAVGWRRNRDAAVLLTLALLVPITLVYLASLQRPLFTPKYLIIAGLPFTLLVATTLSALRGWRTPAGLVSVALVLAIQSVGVERLLGDERYANADWRAAARLVAARERPGDGIVYGHDGMKWLFGFYHPAGRDEYIPPFDGAQRRQEIEATLETFGATHDRVWFVPWWNSDTDIAVERWLNANAYLALDRWVDRSIRILQYASPTSMPPARLSGATFDGTIRLDAWSIDHTTAEQGDILRVDLHWAAIDEVETDLKRLLVLRDSAGRRLAANDRAPRNAPTTGWQPGRTLIDRVGLSIPPGTPAGDYELAVGLYESETGASLPPDSGAQGGLVRLGTVTIGQQAPVFDAAAVEADRLLSAEIAPDVRLIGASYSAGARRQGDIVELTTFWQPAAAGVDAEVRVGLGERSQALDLDLARLPAGAIARRDTSIRVPPTISPGRYELWASGDRARVSLGTIEVVAAPPLAEGAPPERKIGARFGDLATLIGATVRRDASGTEVRLAWRAEREVDGSLAVFVHLVDETGRILVQSDGIPAGGAAPASRWTAGLRFEDIHRLASEAPGRIVVGLYDPATGRRVPVDGGDSVTLP